MRMIYSKEILSKLYGDSINTENFENRINALSNKFSEVFNSKFDDIFSSPGRIEICGNHTDHNYGKVVVGTINCDMLCLTKRANNIVVISEGFPRIELDTNNLDFVEDEKASSKALIKGVLKGFINNGLKIGGFHATMNSTVFNGAGVSSSAAYELLICQILNYYYNDNKIDPITLAKIGQYSENIYFGKPCGLLDQSGIALGGISTIDFKNPELPIVEKLGDSLAGLNIIIINTGNHANLTADYAAIKSEMGDVAKFFNKKVLREVKKNDFINALPELKQNVSGRAILRALHFFQENERVDSLKNAIKQNDVSKIKILISASGDSSANLLQNNYPSNDTSQGISLVVNIARELVPGVASRVHGGGFAGTAILFTEKENVDVLVKNFSNIFGAENIFQASIREKGACHVDF